MKGRKRFGRRRANRGSMPTANVGTGPGSALVRFWQARLLGEGQRVSRVEVWRRLRRMWAENGGPPL